LFKNENLHVLAGTRSTTERYVLCVASSVPTFKQLDMNVLRNIGTSKIDGAFEKLTLARLYSANQVLPMGIDLEDAAWHVTKNRI
jgi:hypothetical protein